jgi:hypothetical protein
MLFGVKDWNLARPIVAAYENEGVDSGDGGEGGTGGDGGEAGTGGTGGDSKPNEKPAGPGGKTFTEEDVNKIVQERLAKDRKRREEAYKDLETKYADMLKSQSLTEEERGKLETNLEDVRKQLRTKDQQAAHERKTLEDRYQAELKSEREAKASWEGRFKESLIARALQDAAVKHEAYNPAQIVKHLRENTKVVEKTDDKGKPTGEYVPMVDFHDVHSETGEPLMTQRTPEDAVKRMKELPDQYGNFFKTNVVSGIGGNSATGGLQPGAGGKLSAQQIKNLTPEQYRKIRQENPALLGLAPRR